MDYPNLIFRLKWEAAGVEYGKIRVSNGQTKSHTIKKLRYYETKNADKQIQNLITDRGLNFNRNEGKNEK